MPLKTSKSLESAQQNGKHNSFFNWFPAASASLQFSVFLPKDIFKSMMAVLKQSSFFYFKSCTVSALGNVTSTHTHVCLYF